MNKQTVIALACLAGMGAASAQVAGNGAGPVTGSSVNLFGVIDAAAQFGDGSINDNTRLVSGAHTSSRLGFRGVEDLGGGLGAGFWLEIGVNADDGTGQASNTNNQPSGAGVAGARSHSGPCREAAKEINSTVPWIGFPVGYAVSGILLTIFGYFAMVLAR